MGVLVINKIHLKGMGSVKFFSKIDKETVEEDLNEDCEVNLWHGPGTLTEIVK